MKRTILALICATAIFAVGCADPYGACAKASADIASGVGAGFAVVTQLYASGAISKQEAANVAGYLEYVNKSGETLGVCAQQAHTVGGVKGSYTACAQTVAKQISDPQALALIHVTDSKAQATVSGIANSVSVGVQALIVALGGK